MNKADKLNYMVNNGVNVAQFISIDRNNPNTPEYCHIRGDENREFDSIKEAILSLIKTSKSKEVNIRSFSNDSNKGNRFVMGKSECDIEEILRIIKQNSDSGLNSIVNENIDVCDGGVSGVAIGDVIEFSPNDTPRCVEKEGVCSLPRDIGIGILETVYGFDLDMYFGVDFRVEFSIHPIKQGILDKHVIIWEYEKMEQSLIPAITFPNNFSKHIGDKVFGLLVAESMGFNIPKTIAIPRKVAPFTFGQATGNDEVWLRTAPNIKEAGKYTTCKGWTDPFILMENEDGAHKNIGSIISQKSVNHLYSGAAMVYSNKALDVIEGVNGSGEDFMVGEVNKTDLPKEILRSVEEISDNFRLYHSINGDITYEWVYDGDTVWVVQLNQLNNASHAPNVIVDGDVHDYIRFDVTKGIEALRCIVANINKKTTGIELVGDIGITSHLGDIMRLNNIPSRISKN